MMAGASARRSMRRKLITLGPVGIRVIRVFGEM